MCTRTYPVDVHTCTSIGASRSSRLFQMTFRGRHAYVHTASSDNTVQLRRNGVKNHFSYIKIVFIYRNKLGILLQRRSLDIYHNLICHIIRLTSVAFCMLLLFLIFQSLQLFMEFSLLRIQTFDLTLFQICFQFTGIKHKNERVEIIICPYYKRWRIIKAVVGSDDWMSLFCIRRFETVPGWFFLHECVFVKISQLFRFNAYAMVSKLRSRPVFFLTPMRRRIGWHFFRFVIVLLG